MLKFYLEVLYYFIVISLTTCYFRKQVFTNLENFILVFLQLKDYLMNDFVVLCSYGMRASVYYVLIKKNKLVLTSVKLECLKL